MRASVLATVLSLGLLVAHEARAEEAAPPLALGVVPGQNGGPWTLRVENTGELPVRIAADPRLLVLEVTPPAGTTPAPTRGRAPVDPTVTCALPEDARPQSDEGQELVVPAKRSWSLSIDPLLYCFDAKARAALVPGATVRARFGWLPKASRAKAKKGPEAPSPPFVANPVGASVGKIAPAKVLEAAPFALTEEQRVTAAPPLPAASKPSAETQGLSLSSSATLDAARGVELPVTVTLTNEGDRAAALSFRPEMIRFRVAGPAGTIACGNTVERASPIRELFTTIAPRGRASLTVLLAASCPADTFDKPGLYRATAILDTSLASGRSIGIRSFDGVVTAQVPTLVRVRTEKRPTPAKKPVLD